MTFSYEELAAFKAARDAQLGNAFNELVENMVSTRAGIGTDKGAVEEFERDVELIRKACGLIDWRAA